ncbi:Mutator-like transposase domain-containing protein [Camponotus japonicus]
MSNKLYAGHKGNKNRSTPHRRSKISNRRPPNRHSFECDSEFVSALAKKLKLDDDDKCEREINESFGYRFIDFMTVFTALAQVVVCKECKGDISFSEGSRRGLGSKIIVSCKNCDDHFIQSCPVINARAYEINTRIIIAAEDSISDITKEARRSITSARKKKEEENAALEGQLYGAGIAE